MVLDLVGLCKNFIVIVYFVECQYQCSFICQIDHIPNYVIQIDSFHSLFKVIEDLLLNFNMA